MSGAPGMERRLVLDLLCGASVTTKEVSTMRDDIAHDERQGRS
jgi:hypothetical protein